MERYSGFIQKGYRFVTYVPTSIYDPRLVTVEAYRGNLFVDEICFAIREMPRWNIPYQALQLSKSDEKTLDKMVEKLMRKLPHS